MRTHWCYLTLTMATGTAGTSQNVAGISMIDIHITSSLAFKLPTSSMRPNATPYLSRIGTFVAPHSAAQISCLWTGTQDADFFANDL